MGNWRLEEQQQLQSNTVQEGVAPGGCIHLLYDPGQVTQHLWASVATATKWSVWLHYLWSSFQCGNSSMDKFCDLQWTFIYAPGEHVMAQKCVQHKLFLSLQPCETVENSAWPLCGLASAFCSVSPSSYFEIGKFMEKHLEYRAHLHVFLLLWDLDPSSPGFLDSSLKPSNRFYFSFQQFYLGFLVVYWEDWSLQASMSWTEAQITSYVSKWNSCL